MAIDITKGQFSIEGSKIKTFLDIQRTFMWEVWFKGIGTALGLPSDMEDTIILHARSASIPARGNDEIESNFGGMKQFFPGKPTFGSNDTTIEFEETEDQTVTSFLYTWNEMIFGTNSTDASINRLGHSNGVRKRDSYTCDIELIPFKYGPQSGSDKLPYKFVFKNAWLSNVGEVSLAYADSGAVKYSATFKFDFWELHETSGT